jgi:hypothetical protein
VEFDCDWCARERWINVVTSAPYAIVGATMLRYEPQYNPQLRHCNVLTHFTDTCARAANRLEHDYVMSVQPWQFINVFSL